jgi:hypothetical protein
LDLKFKRDKMTGWRKLHNEKFHRLYSSSNNIRMIKSRKMRGRACSMHGEMRHAYKILIGKPEGKRPLGSPRHMWEDFKMDLREWV